MEIDRNFYADVSRDVVNSYGSFSLDIGPHMWYTVGMETASSSPLSDPASPLGADPTDAVGVALRLEAEGLLRRLREVRVEGVSITLSPRSPTVCLPGELVRMGALAVLFGLDGPAKWEAALAAGWVPEALREWLGVRGLDEVAAKGNVGWVAPRAFIERLSERVGEVLVELAQPRAGAAVRQTLRRLFLYRGAVQDGGLVLGTLYWKRFLRDAAKPLRATVREEVRRRIAFALGQVERAERAPGHWRPIPGLTPEARAVLEAARGGPPPGRLLAFEEAFEAGLFDFIPDLVAVSYSAVGRRAYHPLWMWRVVTAMLAKGEMEAGRFVAFAGDSVHYRLYLGVRSEAELPSPRRIKGFLAERLAPVAEHLVRGLSVALVTRGGVARGDEFGTDGVEMAAQARTKSDAALAHLRTHQVRQDPPRLRPPIPHRPRLRLRLGLRRLPGRLEVPAPHRRLHPRLPAPPRPGRAEAHQRPRIHHRPGPGPLARPGHPRLRPAVGQPRREQGHLHREGLRTPRRPRRLPQPEGPSAQADARRARLHPRMALPGARQRLRRLSAPRPVHDGPGAARPGRQRLPRRRRPLRGPDESRPGRDARPHGTPPSPRRGHGQPP